MGIATIILLVTLALWAAGFLLLGRLLRRCGGQGSPGTAATVSIIIPARNEEPNLPTLLRSIASQPVKPREIIVVDDGSTDCTAELARQLGAAVIVSQPLPDGWRGKTWACHQGAQAASGDLLLFLDADTWFEPDGLAQILSLSRSQFVVQPSGCRAGQNRLKPALQTKPGTAPESTSEVERDFPHPGGAFSVGPYHAVRKSYEDLSLFFNVNMNVGTVPDGLFGQMLLVDGESYRRVGGHEAVRERILENFWLAAQFRAAGIPVRSVTGRGAFSFRMYPNGLGELIEGWTKGFASGAGQTPRGTLLVVVAWMTGLMLPPILCLATSDWLQWGAVYLLCAAQVAWISRLVGAFRWYTALLYPVPLIFFFAVFARSAMRSGKAVTWKGREIRAD
jgi:4,4'-diaponeurosporenoate glycosyltransferase